MLLRDFAYGQVAGSRCDRDFTGVVFHNTGFSPVRYASGRVQERFCTLLSLWLTMLHLPFRLAMSPPSNRQAIVGWALFGSLEPQGAKIPKRDGAMMEITN